MSIRIQKYIISIISNKSFTETELGLLIKIFTPVEELLCVV